MSTAIMMERVASAPSHRTTRSAGVFYLVALVSGVMAILLRNMLVIDGNAAATAANIAKHEPLFRLAFSADVLSTASYIAVTVLLYDLFKPVSRNLSLLAAFFALTGCAIDAVSCVLHLVPLALLGRARFLSIFPLEQLQTLALKSMQWRAEAADTAFIFFGAYCLLIGWLIFRSRFIPPLFGALLIVGGMAWLTFLFPPLTLFFSSYAVVFGLLGEASLTLWLLFVGVSTDVTRTTSPQRRIS